MKTTERKPRANAKPESAAADTQPPAGTRCLCIRGGHVVDPANGRSEVDDLWLVDGRVAPEGFRPPREGFEEIDASGLVVAPGLIDIHVHLREPGQTHKETIATGAAAAAAGGFTSVVCMPNTSPPADNAGTIALIREQAAASARINVFTTGAITRGLEGAELAPYGSMVAAGIVAITDDGRCVQNHEVMRRAVEYARMFGLPVMDHCQDESLTSGAVMHEGEWSLRLGLPGWPRVGEELVVARNILLAELCDSPIHCQHVSACGSVRLLRGAKERGVPVTGEVCPHHVWFTDERLEGFDANFKMNPPLRSDRDVGALLEGIADGTLDILCSDHAPHAYYEKEVEIDHAPFGITGLETELAAFLDLLVHRRRVLSLERLIACFTANPARLLKLDRGTLSPGASGDVTLIDPDLEWIFDREQSLSLSRNTPFHGVGFKGRAVRTIVAGGTVWALE
jgi:dihydroorotase